tara:strand:+ start:986 stop:1417 length:432 start_codon:yes stop_codon:yes gene_type:complete
MKSYIDFLKKLKKCPFCHFKDEEIIKQNKYAILTLAKAPYIKGHLLIIPKKHSLTFGNLIKKEKLAILKLISYGMKNLKKKGYSINVLYREGSKEKIGKSIPHMHVHIIPNILIRPQDENVDDPKIFSDEDYIKKIKEFKKGL